MRLYEVATANWMIGTNTQWAITVVSISLQQAFVSVESERGFISDQILGIGEGNEICGQWSVDTPVRCVWYELYCRMIRPAFLGESFWIVLEHRKWAIDYITYMYTWLVFVFTNLSISYLVVGLLLIELICLPGLHHHIHHLWQWQWLSITIVFNLSAPLHQHPSAPHKRFKSITMFPSKLNIFLSKTIIFFPENWILLLIKKENIQFSGKHWFW